MPYNILLVDDDAEFRREFCDAFSEYGVIQASGGEEALRILKKPNEIDIAVLDVMMPGLKGTEVLSIIKQDNPGLPVVILTGRSTKEIAVEALKGRADDYLEKPVDVEETGEIIKRILHKNFLNGHTDAGDIDGKIERVKEYILRNCDKKITLKDAAGLVCLSQKYLSRVFEQKTGKTFMNFKTCVKIKYSEKLFKRRFNINQAAERTGYENVESFIRAFKKVRGVTPSIFRKLLMERGRYVEKKQSRETKRAWA
jgi:two-component system response regulator YesN